MDKYLLPNDSIKSKSYIFSSIILVILNFLIFAFLISFAFFFSSEDSFKISLNTYSFIIGWTLFNIITVLIILFVGFRNIEKFRKRTFYSSLLIYLGLAITIIIASSIKIIYFPSSAEARWGLIFMPVVFMVGIYFAFISNIISSIIYKIYLSKIERSK